MRGGIFVGNIECVFTVLVGGVYAGVAEHYADWCVVDCDGLGYDACSVFNGRDGCFVGDYSVCRVVGADSSPALWTATGRATVDATDEVFVQASGGQYCWQWVLSDYNNCWDAGRQFPKRGGVVAVLFRCRSR